MTDRLRQLSAGPLTSDPIDLAPWLKQVRAALEQTAAGQAGQVLSQALDPAHAAQVTAARLQHTQLLALHQVIGALLTVRERLQAGSPALGPVELLIGALGLAYEDLRAGTTTHRATVEQALARLQSH